MISKDDLPDLLERQQLGDILKVRPNSANQLQPRWKFEQVLSKKSSQCVAIIRSMNLCLKYHALKMSQSVDFHSLI